MLPKYMYPELGSRVEIPGFFVPVFSWMRPENALRDGKIETVCFWKG